MERNMACGKAASLPCREYAQCIRIGVLCLVVFLAPSLASGEPEDVIEPQIISSSTHEIPSDAVQEELTQAYLKEMITGLNAKLAVMNAKHLWQDGKWAVVLRNRLIDLSMWWKFADVTHWVLCTFGDDASVREALFFVMPFLDWMCEPFVFPVDTAPSEEQVRKEIDRLAQFISLKKEEGIAVSLDRVGEASLSQDEASQYLHFYIQLIRHLATHDDIEEINLSLKLSALVYEWYKLGDIIDVNTTTSELVREKAAEVKEILVKLLMVANEVKGKKTLICVDMEEYAYKNATLALYKQVVEENPDLVRDADGTLRLGVVIQAYLRDSYKDLEDLMRWGKDNNLRVPIGLVEGVYGKYEKGLSLQKGDTRSPVWSNKESADASYEKLSEFLILNQESFQAVFATHNIRSMAHAMALASSYGIGKSEFEFQMLYGIGDEIKEVITTMGYGMRIQVPVCTHARSLKYAGRRFSELADKDSTLSRTLRGDYSGVEGPVPKFKGPEDISDGEQVEALVAKARARFSGEE